MKYYSRLIFMIAIIFVSACSSGRKTVVSPFVADGKVPEPVLRDDQTFQLDSISVDPSYGYSQQNPVMVGKDPSGPLNERRFLNGLLGPNGEEITYNRRGSCCPFKTPNGLGDAGLLDMYEISFEGTTKKVMIFINMYDLGILRAPKGFTFKK